MGSGRQACETVRAAKKGVFSEDDTGTPHVLGKLVSRFEMDSRWALAGSVQALVAVRDALKDKLKTRQCATSNVATGPDIDRISQTRGQ